MLIADLFEAYWSTQTVASRFYDGPVDIFENPSRAELIALVKEHGSARGRTDGTNVYAWRGDVLHGYVKTPGPHHLEWINEGKLVLGGMLRYSLAPELVVEWRSTDGMTHDEILAAMRAVPPLSPLIRGFKLTLKSVY